MTSDNETTAIEDWFKSQGHTLNEPKVGIRQRLKNAYIGKCLILINRVTLIVEKLSDQVVKFISRKNS